MVYTRRLIGHDTQPSSKYTWMSSRRDVSSASRSLTAPPRGVKLWVHMTVIAHVDIAEIRQNLPSWLNRVRGGEEVAITDCGQVLARLVPPTDRRAEARQSLEALRARVGDVESPIDEAWSAEDDRT